MTTARVLSVDALLAVRSALATFQEQAETALGSLRQETRRTMAWLEQERPHYWQEQQRRAFDLVAATRTALEACRLRTVAGHRSACIEEQVAHRRAKERLEYCQDQAAETRRWALKSREQVDQFSSQLGPLERTLTFDVPAMLVALEGMIRALEAYSQDTPTAEPSGGALAASSPQSTVATESSQDAVVHGDPDQSVATPRAVSVQVQESP